jgi:hypothetical protein
LALGGYLLPSTHKEKKNDFLNLKAGAILSYTTKKEKQKKKKKQLEAISWCATCSLSIIPAGKKQVHTFLYIYVLYVCMYV